MTVATAAVRDRVVDGLPFTFFDSFIRDLGVSRAQVAVWRSPISS